MKVDWKNKELLVQLIKESTTQSDVLRKMNISLKSGNYQTLLRYVNKYNIDISHLDGKAARILKLRNFVKTNRVSNEDFFIKGEKRTGHNIKNRLINENLKEHKCEECGCLPEWNGKPLSLQLDHINGDNCDNRLENLRFLCPNCHSQTTTFSGKNTKKHNKDKYFDIVAFEKDRKAPSKEEIQVFLNNYGIKKSYNHFRMGQENFELLCKYYEINLTLFKDRTKIDWPSIEELQKLVLENTLTNSSKILGVSDNAIKKHAIKNKVFLPTTKQKGYWNKVYTKTICQIKFEDLILENGEYKLSPNFNITQVVVS